MTIVEGREEEWFWKNMELKLGDGGMSDFWEGAWAGEKTLKERFPRLYQLSFNRNRLVKEMGR